MAVSNIIRKELQQLRWIIFIGLLLSLLLAVILVSTFHYLDQIVADISPELMELLTGYEITRELLFIFGDYSTYIWSQWNAKNLYQIGALFAIIIAAVQFAGEVSKGTISFYLTRPISRREGYLAKTVSALVILVLVIGGGTIIIWAASVLNGQGADWVRFFGAALIALIWLFAYYILCTVISILNREPVTAGVLSGLAGIILSLPGLFTSIRPLSIFYQMRAVDYFIYETPLLSSLAYGLILALVLFCMGQLVFNSRDY